MRHKNSRRYDHNRIHVVKIRVGLWHEELHVERPFIGEKLLNRNWHCFDFFSNDTVKRPPQRNGCSVSVALRVWIRNDDSSGTVRACRPNFERNIGATDT